MSRKTVQYKNSYPSEDTSIEHNKHPPLLNNLMPNHLSHSLICRTPLSPPTLYRTSTLPHLHNLLNHLPAHRAVMILHLPRAIFTRSQVSARQEDRIDLILPAYVTEVIFLICMIELHYSLAKAFPVFELSRVDIAMFDVFHSALTIGLIGCPFALVAVAVGIVHGASATFLACDEIPIVIIAGWCN